MEEGNKELLLEKYPIPITIEETYKIIEQMEKYICKIYKNKGGKGTGFFANIPFENIKIPVLITNHHIINKEYINKNKTINITINDDKNNIIIKIGNNRRIYSSEKYDTTIIEIFPKEDKINYFLEFEDNIFKEGSKNFYENQSIYVIQYPKSIKAAVSYGILKEIRDHDILHCCSTEKGSSGSPILSILNKKVIGIHKEGINHFNFNKGTFLKFPINEFINNIKNNNNSIINLNIDNENNNDNIIDKYDNISDNTNNFLFPITTGLTKIGENCFFNSFLQCFCHISKFVNFFKYNNQIKNIFKNNKDYLSASFKLILEKLWKNNSNSTNKNNNYYNPEEFRAKISKMIPSFDIATPNNLKYLIIFFITTLHKELNKVDNNINQYNNLNFDQYDQITVLNNYIIDFNIKNESIISDLFYSANCNKTKCSVCQKISYAYETFFFIPFSLSYIFEFKYKYNYNHINNLNMSNFNNNIISIYDCFDFSRRFDINEQGMTCNNCKINTKYSMQTNLASCSDILILLFYNKGKEFIKVKYEKELNLQNYIEQGETGYFFNLIGIITYFGKNGNRGHFISYCLDPIIKQWFKYDNEKCSQINYFQNEIIDFSIPYILFYEKKK